MRHRNYYRAKNATVKHALCRRLGAGAESVQTKKHIVRVENVLRFEKRQPNTEIDVKKTSQLLAKETGFEECLCRLLCMRGITDSSEAKDFMQPSISLLCDPFLFSDMQKTVDRIEKAIQSGENICIYGDYDVDGICATSILYMYLRHRKAKVSYYIPSRQTEGYGMNCDAIQRLSESGMQLIVTVDNGITATCEIEYANSRNIDVIVTDHHKCSDKLPVCFSLLCHTKEGETYPNKSICGAGTALKLIQAMGGEKAAEAYLPFAALATVADVVELKGENRTIVALGLKIINSENCPVGIKALADIARPNRKSITERDFAFAIAPRLNAAGRISSAAMGVELLCEQSYDAAIKIATELNELNERRKTEEAQIVDSAIEQINDLDLTQTRILILKSSEWNPGILGIAAARIAERFYRPTILFSEQDGKLSGSARSINGINIYDAMLQFKHMCIKFGGHSYAAGITISTEHFKEYCRLMNEYLQNTYDSSVFIPKRFYDDETDFGELTTSLVDSIEKLAPFGEGNPRPLLLAKGVTIQKMQRIGAQRNHINGRIGKDKYSFDMVSFDKGHIFFELVNAQKCDITYSPSINSWGGSSRLQLQISDFCPSKISDPQEYFQSRSDNFLSAIANNLPLKLNSGRATAATEFDRQMLIDELTTSCDGNLVLINSSFGAAEFCVSMQQHELNIDTGFFTPQSPPYNAAVFAPKLSQFSGASKWYRNIFIFDDIISEIYEAAISAMFPTARIYVPKNMPRCPERQIFKEACTRVRMGGIYTVFSRILSQNPQYQDILIERAQALCGENTAVCDFALTVFLELDLFFIDNNDRICKYTDKRQVNLENSHTYITATQL